MFIFEGEDISLDRGRVQLWHAEDQTRTYFVRIMPENAIGKSIYICFVVHKIFTRLGEPTSGKEEHQHDLHKVSF